MVFCGCAHRSSSPVTCGPQFSALSHDSVGTVEALDERPGEEVTSVRVVGVDPALARTLTAGLETKVGMPVSEAPLGDDVRRLWKSGVVADARVELEGETGVVFLVEPRAKIERIAVRGGDAEMARRFRLLAGAPFEPARLQRMADQAQLSYIRAGHTEARVEVRQARRGSARSVCIAANPGPKLVIGELRFPGRAALAEDVLVGAIRGEDKLNRVGGTFDAGALAENKIHLEVLYWEAGYANVRFGEPVATRRGSSLIVEWPIDEGPKFRFGKISTKHRISHPIGLVPGDVFGRTKVIHARDRLIAELGVDDAIPVTKLDLEAATVDITFHIHWRWPWQALALSSFSSR